MVVDRRQEHLQNKRNSDRVAVLLSAEAAMIDRREIQAELTCARQARLAVEAAGCEIEALVVDMQRQAWHRVALVDDTYDPHLFVRPN